MTSLAPSAGQPLEAIKSTVIACLCAPYDLDAAAQARKSLAAPAFDWQSFVQFVHAERVSPLIHHGIGSWGLLPADVADSVRRVYLHNTWTNALRVEELEKILVCFQSAGIPIILLKGAALLLTIYEKGALRPMVDMDLLVTEETMDKAKQIMLTSGYRCIAPPISHKDFLSELVFQKAGQPSWMVEIHSSLFNPPHRLSSAQMEWFHQRSRVIRKGGLEVRAFAVEAQILHLSAHLWLHHGGGDLLGMHDIYQLIRQNRGQINWGEVLAIAKKFELFLPLQKTLPELARKWKSPIPANVLIELEHTEASRREQMKLGTFFGDDHNYLATLFASAMSYPKWIDRLRFLWLIAFPPVQFMRERYEINHALFIPYYYAYRLGSRCVQQIGRAMKRRSSFPPLHIEKGVPHE